ncbi:MAG: glycosyltransferase [Armatimonadetes bacterium]|nr:MAG: glycosyltransferase [Armatimonadota bacterium]
MSLKVSGALQKINCPAKDIKNYRQFVPEVVDQVLHLAQPLQGLKIAHVNATALGGGVAEMLRSVVPLQQSIGLDSNWYVIPPNDLFFEVTKNIHNFMQGAEGDLNEEMKKIYLDYNRHIASLLAKIKADVLLIHDPQPAAALSFLEARPKLALWRCHIDTSRPNPSVWKFLLPFLTAYDHHIFTLSDFTHQGLPADKLSFITPVIDPLAEKNIPMEKERAKEYLKQFGINPGKPLITQVSRFDPWKDPEGVIDAYRLAKKEFPDLQLAMVAQMATDDPEGAVIYNQVKDYAKNEEGIFLLVNLPENDLAVNAFQVASDIILQKSIREGFGLTVTEAMWKGAVMIGGNVGGIKLQIKDEQTGFLVNSSAEAAEKIIYILRNPKIKEKLSLSACESVRARFLSPHNLLHYLNLFRQLLPMQTTKENTPLSLPILPPS